MTSTKGYTGKEMKNSNTEVNPLLLESKGYLIQTRNKGLGKSDKDNQDGDEGESGHSR
jgi:hypothetical protein